MSERRAADHAVRQRVLDEPDGSFIVQAPAGSGKTELLVQRFLRLLAIVARPEEVLAITFTRKAAGEMRGRILESLVLAASDPPAEPHRRQTFDLARAALERDRAREWGLQDSPGRLRVETIDALNAWLARQLPVSSGMGAAAAVAEDAALACREAVRRVLLGAGTDHPAGPHAAALLSHLGNRFEQAEEMLVALLARRDHWLGRVVGERVAEGVDRRARLEGAIARFVGDELARLRAAFPVSLAAEIGTLLGGAARRAPPESNLAALEGLGTLPETGADSLPAWRALASLLLTADKRGRWRKAVNRRNGFGPEAGAERRRMLDLLEALKEHPALARSLRRAASLPDPSYGDERWAMLEHLLALLPLCVAELNLEFAARGETDYVGVAQAALRALGEPDEPTDLALALDYRIRHILVDEFQDTSQAQVELLERLTAGWTPGDGRTLFCVGDPMQSIYRFREADVGRFLRAQQTGIGGLRLEPLTLSVNFRSQARLVEWVSSVFPDIFPARADLPLGAVPFAPSQAWHGPLEGEAVCCHAVDPDDPRQEAAAIAALVAQLRDEEPDASIAILVRARAHLRDIAPALSGAGLRFRTLDIQPLARAPVVQDLVALTRALCHRADRIAWLAVLRAPWCGLSLADLMAVAGGRGDDPWARINDAQVCASLTPDARRRLARLTAALEPAVGQRGSQPLRRIVESAWLGLGGPATLESPSELVDARRYFEFLEERAPAGDLDDPAALDALAEGLYAAPDVEAGPELQLLTVHKAKGLEFDHVILPGLHRRVGGEGKRLLRWLELVRPDRIDLILAPVEPLGEEHDPLHAALKDLERRRESLELDRLLYVALTRARRRLHLFGGVAPDDAATGEAPLPAAGLPLERLWSALGRHFLAARESAIPATRAPPAAARLARLPADWAPPPLPPPPTWQASTSPAAEAPHVRYDWAGRESRAIGIALHRLLQVVARDGPVAWPASRVAAVRPLVEALLTERGIGAEGRAAAAGAVLDGLSRTLADPRARWLLDPAQRDARSERPVSGRLEGQVVSSVVDRSFIADDGALWIVDFKTGLHEGAGLEEFLDREQERYAPQLGRYAALLAPLHEGPVRLGLYFPRHAAWREWGYTRPAA